jgi:hypothetical protein
MYVVCITCVKSSVVRGPGPVVRRRSPRSLPEPAPRRPPTHTSDSAPTRRPSSHSSHPNQFAVSCPIYLYSYAPIHIRCIGFAWHVCIPEHCDYRCSLMRALGRSISFNFSLSLHLCIPFNSLYPLFILKILIGPSLTKQTSNVFEKLSQL